MICTSVNEQIVHGIPGKRRLKEGEILSIDAGAIVEGWHADAAVTVPVGQVSAQAAQLISVTEEALRRAIAAAVVGRRLGDIGAAVQRFVEGQGFSVVRNYVGHGIGRAMHEEPQVPNYGAPERGLQIKEGLCIAIEPMVNVGGPETRTLAGPVDRRHRGRQPVCPFRAHPRLHGGRPDRPHGARGQGGGRRMTTRCPAWAVSVQFSLPVGTRRGDPCVWSPWQVTSRPRT